MLYLFGLVMAYGFAVPVAAFAGGLAQGRAVSAALEASARQPEAAGRLLSLMVIGLAFIESLTLYALVISLILLGKLPSTDAVLSAIGAAAR
jgi:F-type H+-transporting ATPase subunit c